MRIKDKITILSFAASIMIIYIHAYNAEVYNLENSNFVSIFETFVNKVVSNATGCFFLISGFLFFRNFTIRKFPKKLENRIFSLVVPYIIWASLYYLYYVIVTRIPFIHQTMNGDSVIKLSVYTWLRWLGPDKYFTLWFLQNLMFIVLLTPIIWILVNNHIHHVPTGCVGLIIVIICAGKLATYIPFISGIELFSIGAFIALNGEKAYEYHSKLITQISIGLLFACAIIYFVLAKYIDAMPYSGYVKITLSCCLIWFALDLLPLDKYNLPWWMKITFFTYVAHSALLEIIEKFILIIAGRSALMAFVDYIFAPIITEVILILIAAFMKKYMKMIWKIISGRRNVE